MRPAAGRTPFHSLRSAMLAAAALTLAAGAHVLAGGQLPAPGILLGLFALTSLAGTAATRLRLNSVTLTALLGAGQLVLHEAFSALGSGVQPGRVRRGDGLLAPLGCLHRPAAGGTVGSAHSGFPARGRDARRAYPGNAGLRRAPRQGRGRPVVARRVASPAGPAPRAVNARRRRVTGGGPPSGGGCTPALAEPPVGLPPRAAARRRRLLTVPS